MDFDLPQIQALMDAERERRRLQAPRNRRDLEGYLIIACALSIASVYDPALMPGEVKNRVMWLWENDSVFHHTVKAAVVNIMRLLDDYAYATGLDLR